MSLPPDSRATRRSCRIFYSYALDGNAHFFTAVEVVRRSLAVANSQDAIVVAIGYPECGHYVFGNRRGYDLTPPCEPYVPPRSWDGREFTLPHGGADELLKFIQGPVRSRLFEQIFPGLHPAREILVGHSFGGLCTLHALFRRDTYFDTFIAISPTVWWSDRFLLSEEKTFCGHQTQHSSSTEKPPLPLSLYISYGHYEQHPQRRKAYSDDEFARRTAHALALRTGDDANDMAERLRGSGRFELVKVKEYMDEDHGSVAGCAIGWAMCDVLDPDRFV